MRAYELRKELKLELADFKEILEKLNIKIKYQTKNLTKEECEKINDFLNPAIKIEDTIKEKFSQLQTLKDFVEILNILGKNEHGRNHKIIKAKQLTYYAYHCKDKYDIFEIPKKSGGTRKIYAPKKALKNILRLLNIALHIHYKKNISAHGFLKNRSVATNAKKHIGKNYVLNIDLENFFPNIHQARIWKLIQKSPLNLNQNLANLVANLVCFQHEDITKKNFLPQGAPTSPILSNFICHRLDKKLLLIAKKYGATYTRYADDMTFSSNHNVYQKDGDFLKEIEEIIKSENFTINPKKTRLQGNGHRQEVTGIIVNKKLNVSRKYIKNLRGLLNIVEKFGIEKALENENFLLKNKGSNIELVIFGKLQYLKMIKGENDSTYQKLLGRFESVFQKEGKDTKKHETEKKDEELVTLRKNLHKILTCFTTNNNALKYTSHSWGEGNFESYDDFMKKIRKEWNKIRKELHKNRLSAKIQSFLFNEKLGQLDAKGKVQTWGQYQATFGWSSPELKQWCDNGNDPFEYRFKNNILNKDYKEDIGTFGDLTKKIFKNEIEFRLENDSLTLRKFFSHFRQKLGNNNFEMDIQIEDCKFFTDIHWLYVAVSNIFEEINKRTEYEQIIVKNEISDDCIVIYIIHVNSPSKLSSKELYKRKNKGDFGSICNTLSPICDWSVEAFCKDENFKINFIKSNNEDDIEKLSQKPQGFTHILRFYL